ncbi:MAG: 2-C-methyl-D-erythritol 4-phosphate cytidylyltransferase [Bacteroides sp.]|nr:2-C-methyl-D-erythritol 4-phosphate cytidylyltransferase [Bacteroides sp.]
MRKYVVIVAGGKGLRMGGDLPKQFIPVGGKPVLMHTLNAFYTYDPEIEIILVLPPEHHAYWTELCREYDLTIPHRIAPGGETRFHSVRNGLVLIADDEGLVAVHDGVRPFVSQEVIARCYEAAAHYEAAIPVTDIVETLRRVDPSASITVDRSCYKLVQTPQAFSVPVLKRCYNREFMDCFTDDASVVEAAGKTVHLVEGNRENIKITTPFDLKLAEILLNV